MWIRQWLSKLYKSSAFIFYLKTYIFCCCKYYGNINYDFHHEYALGILVISCMCCNSYMLNEALMEWSNQKHDFYAILIDFLTKRR